MLQSDSTSLEFKTSLQKPINLYEKQDMHRKSTENAKNVTKSFHQIWVCINSNKTLSYSRFSTKPSQCVML